MIAAFSLGFFVIPAFAQDDVYIERPNYWSSNRGDAMLYDLIILRPVGFAALIVGFAGTIVGLPFSIIGNNTREVGEAMIGEPGKFTFCPPARRDFSAPGLFEY